MAKSTVKITKKFLVFPIGRNVHNKFIMLYEQGKMFADILVDLDYINPFTNIYYDVEDFIGKEIEIEMPDGIEYVDMQTDISEVLTDSPYRPFAHFTAPFGWINDPNGMFYYKDEWFLFYQYNPYGITWGNMHWGAARSKDLIHWTHKPIAVYPDEFGGVWSGGAYVDYKNDSGLKCGEDAPILLFYTAGGDDTPLAKGKEFTQRIAYSTDGGETFIKHEKETLIKQITHGNRDPLVVWCDELECYVLSLYIKYEKFVMYKSKNLIDWEPLQEIRLQNDAECPNLFPMNVDGEQKWVFRGAGNRYVVCEVKDGKFEAIQKPRQLSFDSKAYAAQTFSQAPDGRRISMAWHRDIDCADAPFNGQMSIPVELFLKHINGEYVLCMDFVKEFSTLLRSTQSWENVNDIEFATQKGVYDIILEDIEGKAELDIFGKKFVIDTAENAVHVGESKMPIKINGDSNSLRLVLDTLSAEIINGIGDAEMTVSMVCDYNFKRATLKTDGKIGKVTVSKVDI